MADSTELKVIRFSEPGVNLDLDEQVKVVNATEAARIRNLLDQAIDQMPAAGWDRIDLQLSDMRNLPSGVGDFWRMATFGSGGNVRPLRPAIAMLTRNIGDAQQRVILLYQEETVEYRDEQQEKQFRTVQHLAGIRIESDLPGDHVYMDLRVLTPEGEKANLPIPTQFLTVDEISTALLSKPHKTHDIISWGLLREAGRRMAIIVDQAD